MSLYEACGWTLLRSFVIAGAALPLCARLADLLAESRRGRRLVLWGVLLVPFLTPELLAGYAYSNFSLSLIHHPVWNELLYALLVALRVIPIGAAAVYFAPPAPLSEEALYCRRLVSPTGAGIPVHGRVPLSFWLRGPVRRVVPAFGVMFLLVFQEFEMASLMFATSWTVWLFDAHTLQGMYLSESLRLAAVPLMCEAAVLAPVLAMLLADRRWPAAGGAPGRRPGAITRGALCVYLATAAVIVCGLPLWIVGRGMGDGLVVMARNPQQARSLFSEILMSGFFAVTSGAVAYGLAGWLLAALRRPAVALAATLAASVWGLFGSLALGLVILALFQQTRLNVLYDTPVPLLLALTLFLLPRVLLLQILLRAIRPVQGVHLAQLLQRSSSTIQRAWGRELVWHLRDRGHFWLAALACYWAYLDLTCTALLEPMGMATAPKRLYDLMHYGRSEALSAMTVLVVAVPVLIVLLAAAARRPLFRLLFR
jgi:ABC-type Fe3+ transport system permease subunit